MQGAAYALTSSEATASDYGFIWLIIPIVILLIMSGMFSASETAFTSAGKIRLRTMYADGNKKAGKVLRLLDRYDDLLSTVLIGNNIVNIVLTTISTVFFMQLIWSNATVANVISTVATTVVVLVFGEISPKALARHNPEKAALFFYNFVILCYYILFPLNMIFKGWKMLLNKIFKVGKSKSITEEELVTIVETAESEGELDSHESRLIKNAIEFDDLEVRDIMVPRVNITAVADDTPLSEIASVFNDSGYSRLPVYHETVDSVTGVLNQKDFVQLYYEGGERSDARVLGAMQPVLTVAPTMKISMVLRMIQRAKLHMAIVVDEFGGTAGLVTLEDILEELVGEIWDEHDEVEDCVRQTGDDEYVVTGFANLDDLFERLGVNTKQEFDATTVGGWVIEVMGKIPPTGSSFMFENLRVVVTKANSKRVLEVRVKVMPVEEDGEEGLLHRRKEKPADDEEKENEENR